MGSTPSGMLSAWEFTLDKALKHRSAPPSRLPPLGRVLPVSFIQYVGVSTSWLVSLLFRLRLDFFVHYEGELVCERGAGSREQGAGSKDFVFKFIKILTNMARQTYYHG